MAAASLMLMAAAPGAQGFEPCFFFDFDDDGMADEFMVEQLDLEPLEPATRYIGVEWPGHCDPLSGYGIAAAEYQVHHTGMLTPGVSVYAEPGSPDWALSIGALLDGGWFQSSPCRDACPEFIAALSVIGTGAHQTFDFDETSSPYQFPGLIQIYDCVPVAHEAGVINSAACNGLPNTIPPNLECSSEPTSEDLKTWGELKKLLK